MAREFGPVNIPPTEKTKPQRSTEATPQTEQSKEVAALIKDFQTTLKGIPEFRQGIADQFIPDPSNREQPEKVDGVIDTYFSAEPGKGFKALSEDEFNYIIFKRDGLEYNVSLTDVNDDTHKNTNSFMVARYNDEPEDEPKVFDLTMLHTDGSTDHSYIKNRSYQGYEYHYGEDKALEEAKKLLESIKQNKVHDIEPPASA